jgi:hypothetical protein
MKIKLKNWSELLPEEDYPAQKQLKYDKKLQKKYDPKVRAAKARRRASRKYYEKNKEALNRKRKAHQRSPRGQFQSAKRRAERAEQEWRLTFEEWLDVWTQAPKVFDNKAKLWKPAYLMRGNKPTECTQMCRLDTSRGWHLDNVEIRYKLQPIPKHGVLPDWDISNGRPEDIE